MKLKSSFIAILLTLSLASTGIAMASTPEPEQDQSEAVLEYWKLMDSFTNNSFARSKANTYPDYYAGAYLGDSGNLVILTTDMDDSQRSLTKINANFVPAKYSLNELNEINNTIIDYIENHKNEGLVSNISGFGIFEKENRVVVSFAKLTDDVKQAFENNIIKSDAIIFNEKEIMQSQTSVSLGSKAYTQDSSSQNSFSVGFRAQSSYGNGFVSCGHGKVAGKRVYTPDGNPAGTVSVVEYDQAIDASFIRSESQAPVQTKTASGVTIVGNHYVVNFLTGATVKKEGFATGLTTGKIKSTDYTSKTTDGMTVYHTVLADYSSASGDSGGLVYMVVNGDSVPAGIHRGSGNSTAVFCTVQRVIDTLSVTPY